jgi:hypothetical protein
MLRVKWIRLPTLLFLPRRNGEPPGLRRRLQGFLIKKVGCGPVGGPVCRKRNSEPRLLTESATNHWRRGKYPHVKVRL